MADFRSLVTAVAAAGGRSGLPAARRPLDAVCTAFAADLPISGVSVSILSGRTIRETVGSSDALADKIEDEQYALGIGPCYDAFGRGGPVLVADLRDRDENRWPAFSTALVDTPVRAIFAFPLHLGGIVVGAVDTYRTEAGLPNAADLRDLLRAVDLLVVALASARGSGPSGVAAGSADSSDSSVASAELAAVLADGTGETDLDIAGTAALRARSSGWEDFLDGLPSDRIKVHQATGMLIAQQGGSAEQALARMRAYAFAHDRTLLDVAADLVARRLILPT